MWWVIFLHMTSRLMEMFEGHQGWWKCLKEVNVCARERETGEQRPKKRQRERRRENPVGWTCSRCMWVLDQTVLLQKGLPLMLCDEYVNDKNKDQTGPLSSQNKSSFVAKRDRVKWMYKKNSPVRELPIFVWWERIWMRRTRNVCPRSRISIYGDHWVRSGASKRG